MELFAARGYFFCRYCGSFHFPESKSDDGIRIVSDAPDTTMDQGHGSSLSSSSRVTVQTSDIGKGG